MSWGAVAGAAVSVGAGYLSSREDADAAHEARQLSRKAKKKTLAELETAEEDISGWLDPYLKTGEEALGSYKSAIGAAPETPVFDSFNFDYTKMEDNPAFQFVRDQGLQAVDRLAAKNRNLGSGNRMTAAADYASGVASTEYANEFSRQLQSTEYNNQLKQQGFQNQGFNWQTQLGAYGDLATTGANVATNRAGIRERLAANRSNAFSGFAAEQAAANLVETEGKKSFIDAAGSGIGMAAGKYFNR
jgi:hypothetical protein